MLQKGLWGIGKKYRLMLIIGLLACEEATAQHAFPGDLVKMKPGLIFDDTSLLILAHMCHELDYVLSFNASQFLNSSQHNRNNEIAFQHSLTYHIRLYKNNGFSISNTLVHEFGFRFISDSTTQVCPDGTLLSTRISFVLSKKINLVLTSDLATQLHNSFGFFPDGQGNLIKLIYSSFLTPARVNLSLGLGHTWPHFGDFSLGLTSAKLIILRDKRVTEHLSIIDLYGIPAGKNHSFEYGLSARLLADNYLFRKVHWNCDLLLFKGNLSPVDITLKNLLSISLGNFVQTSIQTNLFYESKFLRSIHLENSVNIGVSFHL